MIGKWMQGLQDRGEIIDYDITLDDVTKEFVVHYVIQPPPDKIYVIEFSSDPITQKLIFKGETNESC